MGWGDRETDGGDWPYTIRWPLYVGQVSPASVYKTGCVATDKGNYGGYCIWKGQKWVYKTVNRATFPPYAGLSKIENWVLGKNSGSVEEIDVKQYGPEGYVYNYSGLGKSTDYDNEDGTKKPQPGS